MATAKNLMQIVIVEVITTGKIEGLWLLQC